MKKILLAVIAVCCVAFASCTKEVKYTVQSTEPSITTGYDSEWTAFSNDIQTVMSSIEGTVVTDDIVISEIDDVVNLYNNKHFSCELYLFSGSSKIKTWNIVKGAE